MEGAWLATIPDGLEGMTEVNPLKRNSPRGLCLYDRSNREVKKRPPEKKFVL
jgi:hypothetical protein